MKAVLTRLTLLTTAATVVLLAVYLTRTVLSLIRANRNLAGVAERLEAVRDNTRPLDRDLPAITDAAATLERRLTAVDAHLQAILQATPR